MSNYMARPCLLGIDGTIPLLPAALPQERSIQTMSKWLNVFFNCVQLNRNIWRKYFLYLSFNLKVTSSN